MLVDIRFTRRLVRALPACIACYGCSSATPGTPSGSGGSGGSAGASSTGGQAGSGGNNTTHELIGGFIVNLVGADPLTSTPAFTSVLGKVYDGPVPQAVIWRTVDSGNGCVLLKPRVPFCDPACGAAVCADDNRCVQYPSPQNLGKVRVSGLGETEFDMEPIQGNYQPPGDVRIPYPPTSEGGDIRVQTTGGSYEPFSIQAKGIVPLELFGKGPIPIEQGQPLKLEWAPGNLSSAHIVVELDISHHGGQKGEIACDVADSGSGEIPSKLISGLLALGVAGFPTIRVTRINSATTVIAPGSVTLAVTSGVEREVQIPGVISCNSDADCPSGKTCQADRTCR